MASYLPPNQLLHGNQDEIECHRTQGPSGIMNADRSTDLRKFTTDPHEFKLTSDASLMPLGLFLACKESRAIALKRYSRLFKRLLGKSVYFDWENDTLCLNDPCAWYQFRDIPRLNGLTGCKLRRAMPRWQKYVRRIALRRDIPGEDYDELGKMLFLKAFPSLKTLIIEEDYRPAPRPQNQDSINDKNNQVLRKAWKQMVESERVHDLVALQLAGCQRSRLTKYDASGILHTLVVFSIRGDDKPWRGSFKHQSGSEGNAGCVQRSNPRVLLDECTSYLGGGVYSAAKACYPSNWMDAWRKTRGF
ncbi:hypothetical protein V8E51_005243 [Hyaloscypha variabilis]